MATIAIDTSFTYIARTGMSRYISCLLTALRELNPPDFDFQEIAFAISNESYRQPRRMMLTLAREYVWQPHIAPLAIRRVGAKVFHSTFSACFRVPRGVKHVATIHDLSPIRTPERFRKWARYRCSLDMKAWAKADHIVCVSESTARDVTEFLGIPRSRITVTYLASTFSETSAEEAPGFPLPEQFFLFVSSLETGKNLSLLRESYLLAEQTGAALPPLIIVGSRIPGVAGEGDPPKGWFYTGRLPDSVLAYLYRRAKGLIFPSKNEGFGLPVVEAMSLGCPVICSPVSSLPEVGGPAALYADLNPISYLEEMSKLALDDEEFLRRRHAGFTQASLFSWKRCAQQTLEAYRAVLR